MSVCAWERKTTSKRLHLLLPALSVIVHNMLIGFWHVLFVLVFHSSTALVCDFMPVLMVSSYTRPVHCTASSFDHCPPMSMKATSEWRRALSPGVRRYSPCSSMLTCVMLELKYRNKESIHAYIVLVFHYNYYLYLLSFYFDVWLFLIILVVSFGNSSISPFLFVCVVFISPCVPSVASDDEPAGPMWV